MKNKDILNRIYILQTDFNLFYQKINPKNIYFSKAEKIKINIEFINQNFNSLEIKTIIELISEILEQLKTIKCEENLIFEKSDLIVNIFTVKEKIEKLL